MEVKLFWPAMMLGLSLAPSAHAYDASNEDLLNLSLQELLTIKISTTSKYLEESKDTPANVTIFTRSDIQRLGYQNVEDILMSMSGIDIQKFSLFTSPSQITFRGHGFNNAFLVLQDGIRISSADGQTTSISHNFPVYYAKQVEVLKGPAAAAYGADAFMGVVNIITLDHEDADQVNAQLMTGTEGPQSGVGFIHGHKVWSNGLSVSAGVHGYKSQEYALAERHPNVYPDAELSPTGNPFEFPQDEAHSVFFKLRTAKHWELGLNHSSIMNSTYTASLPTASAFDTDAKQQDLLTTVYGKYKTSVGPGIESSTMLSYMEYEQDNDSNFNNLFTNFVPNYKYAHTARTSINEDLTWRVNSEHFLSAGLVYDDVTTIPVSADLESRYDESKSPSSQTLVYPGTDLPVVIYEIKHQNFGAYFQDNWAINAKLRFVSAIRYDHDSVYGDTVNPRLALIYQPDEISVLKLLYGHSFLAPSPDLAYRNFGSFSGFNVGTGLWESGFFAAPNPDLKPEKLKTFELNYERWLGDNTQIKLATFYTQVDDIIAGSSDSTPIQFIPGADLSFTMSNKNVGEANIFGFELGVRAKHGAGPINVITKASFSFVDGKIKEAGVSSDLPLVSPIKIKGSVSMAYQNFFTLTPEFFWIGRARSFEKDPNNPEKRLEVPGYFLLNLNSEIKVTDTLSVVAKIENAFDTDNENAMLQKTDISTRQALQPARYTTLGVSLNF